MPDDNGGVERRLFLVEEKTTKLDTALDDLRRDLVDTERRLVSRIDSGISDIRHELRSLDSHLTSQDALLNNLALFAATKKYQWPFSLKSTTLSASFAIFLVVLGALLYHFVG